jgi:hypothetical protein
MSEERKIDNYSMRTWLKTIENIVGHGGLKSILNYARLQKYIDSFPPDSDELEIPVEDYTAFIRSLIELFGNKGARSLQIMAGKEAVRVAIQGRFGIAKAFKLQAVSCLRPRGCTLSWQSGRRTPKNDFHRCCTRLELSSKKRIVAFS